MTGYQPIRDQYFLIRSVPEPDICYVVPLDLLITLTRVSPTAGTSEKMLDSYLNQWEEGKDFLTKHTHNPYNGSGTVFTATLSLVVGAFWLTLHY